MKNKNKKLGELLLGYEMISPDNLKKALKVQKENNKRIGETLIELNIVTQDQINWILGKQLDIPYVQIEKEQLDLDLIKRFPEYLIKNYRLIPMVEVEDKMVIAMADPIDDEAIQKIKSTFKGDFEVVLASFRNITDVINYINTEFPEIWQ